MPPDPARLISATTLDAPAPAARGADDPFWYKDAIIYQAHIKSFFDIDNDGMGDLRGMMQKLDYLNGLGITCLWLLPFYPSPLKDDGYDIADYCNVNPRYGTLDDFHALVRAAHDRQIKVLIELVINHTSDQHPWFQRARRAPKGSPEREFYIWSDTDRKFPETRIIFTDTEKSNWTFDPIAGQFYWHRFFTHQPDLNHNNPAVVEAVIDVMRFWLDLGVDALRLDAVPYLCVREGTNNENLPETHAVLRRMRQALDAGYQNRMAKSLVNSLASEWDPTKYTDQYRENLLKLIQAKLKGKKVDLEEIAEPRQAEVVDLMERLRRSLEQSGARATKTRPRAAKRPAKKRPKAAA